MLYIEMLDKASGNSGVVFLVVANSMFFLSPLTGMKTFSFSECQGHLLCNLL